MVLKLAERKKTKAGNYRKERSDKNIKKNIIPYMEPDFLPSPIQLENIKAIRVKRNAKTSKGKIYRKPFLFYSGDNDRYHMSLNQYEKLAPYIGDEKGEYIQFTSGKNVKQRSSFLDKFYNESMTRPKNQKKSTGKNRKTPYMTEKQKQWWELTPKQRNEKGAYGFVKFKPKL